MPISTRVPSAIRGFCARPDVLDSTRILAMGFVLIVDTSATFSHDVRVVRFNAGSAEMNQTRRFEMHDSGIVALAASVRSPRSNPMVVIGGLDHVQSVLTTAREHMEQVDARIQVIHPTDKLRIHWADYWKSFKLFYYRNWHPLLRESHALQTAYLWFERAKEWLLLLDKLLHKHPPDGFPVLPALAFTALLALKITLVSAAACKRQQR